MRSVKLMGVALAALMGLSMAAYAEDVGGADDAAAIKAEKKERAAKEKEAKVKEAKEKPAGKKPQLKITPYRDMTSLSDEQKTQIAEIHNRYLAEKKKLEEQEKAEIRALLSADQVAELEQFEANRAAARKAKEAERRDQSKEESQEMDGPAD